MKYTANPAKVNYLNAVTLPSPKVYAIGEQRTSLYLLARFFERAFPRKTPNEERNMLLLWHPKQFYSCYIISKMYFAIMLSKGLRSFFSPRAIRVFWHFLPKIQYWVTLWKKTLETPKHEWSMLNEFYLFICALKRQQKWLGKRVFLAKTFNALCRKCRLQKNTMH